MVADMCIILVDRFHNSCYQGIFYQALKDFKATPQTDFTLKDANELKAPVLAFVVLQTITEFMSIVVTGYHFKKGDEKKDWPFIISVLGVLFDFAQVVIALITAFKMDKLELEDVQFVRPVFGLIKPTFQLTGLYLIYAEEAPFTRLIEVENDEINYGTSYRKWSSCNWLQWMAFIGNGVNLRIVPASGER